MNLQTKLPFATTVLAAAFLSAGLSGAAVAAPLIPGDLLVTRTVYAGNASTVAVGQALPGGGKAVADGSFPNVFNNETPDPSFGVTSPIYLDQMTSAGSFVGTTNLTAQAAALGINLSTSFPSKSELAINVSTNGKAVTFMGYVAPINTLDVSNSNTTGHVDSTNPVKSSFQRAVAQVNMDGSMQVTAVNAYSGNNGRAAVLANGQYYMVGNAGNGSGTPPTNIVNNTGVQTIAAGSSTGVSTVIGAQQGTAGNKNGFQYGYSVTQNGYAADKSGKDDNFRGMTVYNGTLYVTKGSGSNGINSVYQVGPTGALNKGGALPADSTISILSGFSTTLASASTGVEHPFGLWFANSTTLFVADEGDGKLADAAVDSFAGLSEYQFANGTWSKVMTFRSGLGLGGTVYSNGGYYTVTDGLRNIAGRVNADGTYTIYGITSTANNGAMADAGADPNELVSITIDPNHYSDASFTVLETAKFGEALRGVAIAPVPEPETYAMLLAGLGLLGAVARRRKSRS